MSELQTKRLARSPLFHRTFLLFLLASAIVVRANHANGSEWKYLHGRYDHNRLLLCIMQTHYQDGKAKGFIQINHGNQVGNDFAGLLVLQDGFGSYREGQLTVVFQGEKSITVKVEHADPVVTVSIEKRLADLFIDDVLNSNTMRVEYPSWPEEYPFTIQLPDKTLKQKWSKCEK